MFQSFFSSRPGRLLRLALLALLILGLLLILGRALRRRNDAAPRGATNEQRLTLLRAQGWEVDSEPVTEQKLLLPEEFPQVLLEYNDLQRRQGFDLTPYAGREVTMYRYRVADRPEGEEVYCTLYVRRGRVIGADVHSAAFEGYMAPLLPERKPGASPRSTVKQ